MILKNKTKTIFIIVLTVILLVAVYFIWSSFIIQKKADNSYKSVLDYLKKGEYSKALQTINLITPGRTLYKKENRKWLQKKIIALTSTYRLQELFNIYKNTPDVILLDQKASLILLRGLIHIRDLSTFKKIRKNWTGRESSTLLWFILDVDHLLITGKREETIKLLNSKVFKGKKDCSRLLRLAILYGKTDLKKSWELLAEAYKLDSKNIDVRSFRAQILEQIGKKKQARFEYVAAHLSDPQNPFFIDQLSEFYRRNGNYVLAMDTWNKGLMISGLEFFKLKILFWKKITRTYHLQINDSFPGNLSSFIQYLNNLHGSFFWSDLEFKNIKNARAILINRQESFWLRLLQSLKKRNEEKALELLKYNNFKKRSFAPEIEDLLNMILKYRKTGKIDSFDFLISLKTKINRHQFYKSIYKSLQNIKEKKTLSLPQEIDKLLRSDQIFSAVFLAAGWIEAAIQLDQGIKLPQGTPDWYGYGITQALRINRNIDVALNYAENLKKNPELNLLIGELLLGKGKIEKGLNLIKPLMNSKKNISFRAAWILSIHYINQKDLIKAKNTVSSVKYFFNSITGKEMLVRIYLLEGKITEAEYIYKNILSDSIEAKNYFLKKASIDKNWDLAKQLTEDLIIHMPDNIQLRSNLKFINKHRSKLIK